MADGRTPKYNQEAEFPPLRIGGQWTRGPAKTPRPPPPASPSQQQPPTPPGSRRLRFANTPASQRDFTIGAQHFDFDLPYDQQPPPPSVVDMRPFVSTQEAPKSDQQSLPETVPTFQPDVLPTPPTVTASSSSPMSASSRHSQHGTDSNHNNINTNAPNLTTSENGDGGVIDVQGMDDSGAEISSSSSSSSESPAAKGDGGGRTKINAEAKGGHKARRRAERRAEDSGSESSGSESPAENGAVVVNLLSRKERAAASDTSTSTLRAMVAPPRRPAKARKKPTRRPKKPNTAPGFDSHPYEFCLVFEDDEDNENKVPSYVRSCVRALKQTGLEVSISGYGDSIYVCVWSDEGRLVREACESGMYFEVELAQARKLLQLSREVRYEIRIRDSFAAPPQRLEWRNLFLPMPKCPKTLDDPMLALFRRFDDHVSPRSLFPPCSRICLLSSITDKVITKNGCRSRVHGLPLHHARTIREFDLEWSFFVHGFRPPIDHIRNYFGERVATEFAFQGLLTRWLMVPSLVGVLVVIALLVLGEENFAWYAWFGVFSSTWLLLLLRDWEFEQRRLRIRWGLGSCSVSSTPNDKFSGEVIVNAGDGVLEEIHAPGGQSQKVAYAVSEIVPQSSANFSKSALVTAIVTLFIVVSIATDVTIFVLLLPWIQETLPALLSESVFVYALLGVALLVRIKLYEKAGVAVIVSLVEWENHMAVEARDRSLLLKVTAFSLANELFALLYVALLLPSNLHIDIVEAFVPQANAMSLVNATSFVTDRPAPCSSNCWLELRVLVSIIFSGLFLIETTAWLLRRCTCRNLLQRLRRTVRRAAEGDTQSSNRLDSAAANERLPAPSCRSGLGGIPRHCAYVVLFAPVVPFLAVLILMWRLLETRKYSLLLTVAQRPLPAIDSLATWCSILWFVAFLGLIANFWTLVSFNVHFAPLVGDTFGLYGQDMGLVAVGVFSSIFFLVYWLIAAGLNASQVISGTTARLERMGRTLQGTLATYDSKLAKKLQ